MNRLALRALYSFVFCIFLAGISPAGAETFQPKFESGRYKNLFIDVSSRRSITILERGDIYKVDHFFHQDRWWNAEIEVRHVSRVIGQGFNFSLSGYAPINHVQGRFQMEPEHPIRLTAADGSGDTAFLSDFVSSVEAVGPEGIDWNFKDATFGNLVNAHRFVSIEQVIKDRIILQGYRMPQFEVLLNNEERTNGLVKVLEDADLAGMHQLYYLFRLGGKSSNCTSEKFRALDSILRYKLPFQNFLAHIFDELPLSPSLYLRLRGRLGERLPDLNEEFAPLVLSGYFGEELKQDFLTKFDKHGKKLPKKCWQILSSPTHPDIR